MLDRPLGLYTCLTIALLSWTMGCDPGPESKTFPPAPNNDSKTEISVTQELESLNKEPLTSTNTTTTKELKADSPLSEPITSADVSKNTDAAEMLKTETKTSEEKNPEEAATSETASTTQPVKREIKLLVPQTNFAPEGPEQALRVRYDDLDLMMVLNMDPVPLDAVSHFPEWLKGLEGKKVRIRGFMFPPPRQDGITYFQLARDNEICCFGRDPKVYDLIAVEMTKGTSTSYIPNRPFDVIGVFHIDPFIDGDKMYELYRLDQASIVTR